MDKMGTLLIYVYVSFVSIDSKGQNRRVLMHRTENIGEQQAKGLFMDFRGMNQHYKKQMIGEWEPYSTIL